MISPLVPQVGYSGLASLPKKQGSADGDRSVSASPSETRAQADMLTRTDARMRADLQQLATKAGPNAQVTVEYRYQVGQDGQLYVVGGTVSSSEKISSEEKGTAALQPFGQGASAAPGGFPRSSIALTPEAQAEIFGVTDEEMAHVKKLHSIDAQVRGHEAQHFRAAGGLAEGGPEFTYIQGPDGSYYAVGGQVHVRTSQTSDEGKAARDAATLANAATAPADTSAQDIAAARLFYDRTAAMFQSAANAQPRYFDVAA